MKAHGGIGKIGGLPVKGGIVSLESSDAAAVINATTGLIREATPLALGVAKGALILTLAAMILRGSRKKERKECDTLHSVERKIEDIFRDGYYLQQATDQNTSIIRCRLASLHNRLILHPTSGIILVNTPQGRFHGILLNEKIAFRSQGALQHAKLEHTVFIAKDRNDPKNLAILLREGSIFEKITLEHPLTFMTLMGEISVNAEDIHRIRGLTDDEAKEFKQQLVTSLKQSQQQMLAELGSELVSRYFHIEAPPPPPRLPSGHQTVVIDTTGEEIGLERPRSKDGDTENASIIDVPTKYTQTPSIPKTARSMIPIMDVIGGCALALACLFGGFLGFIYYLFSN